MPITHGISYKGKALMQNDGLKEYISKKNAGIMGEVSNYFVGKLIDNEKIDPTKYIIEFDDFGRITKLKNRNKQYFVENVNYEILYLDGDEIEITKEKQYVIKGEVNKVVNTYTSSGELKKVVDVWSDGARKISMYENGKRVAQLLYDSAGNYKSGSKIPAGEYGSLEYLSFLFKYDFDFSESWVEYDVNGRVVRVIFGNKDEHGGYTWGVGNSIVYGNDKVVSVTGTLLGVSDSGVRTHMFDEKGFLFKIIEKSNVNSDKDFTTKVKTYNTDGSYNVVVFDINTNVISQATYDKDGYDEDGYNENGQKKSD